MLSTKLISLSYLINKEGTLPQEIILESTIGSSFTMPRKTTFYTKTAIYPEYVKIIQT